MTLTTRVTIAGRKIVLTPDLLLGDGREAMVYRHPADPGLAVKVLATPDRSYRRKLEVILRNPLRSPQVAWPLKRVLSADGKRVVGCTMPLAARKWPIACALSNSAQTRWIHADYPWRLTVAINLTAAVEIIHKHDCVVGDISESNCLVGKDGTIVWIDADSYQITRAGCTYRCELGSPEYTSAELSGVAFATVDRTPHSDAFGLPCLIFQLLVGPGHHPFAARYLGKATGLTRLERIAQGVWAYSGTHRDYAPLDAAPLDILHPRLQALMARCFIDGHRDPTVRPLPSEWLAALAEVKQDTDFVTRIAPGLEAAAHARHSAAIRQTLQTHLHTPRPGSPFTRANPFRANAFTCPSYANTRQTAAKSHRKSLRIAALVATVLAVAGAGWMLFPRVEGAVYFKKRGDRSLPTPVLYQELSDPGNISPRFRSIFTDSNSFAATHETQEKTP